MSYLPLHLPRSFTTHAASLAHQGQSNSRNCSLHVRYITRHFAQDLVLDQRQRKIKQWALAGEWQTRRCDRPQWLSARLLICSLTRRQQRCKDGLLLPHLRYPSRAKPSLDPHSHSDPGTTNHLVCPIAHMCVSCSSSFWSISLTTHPPCSLRLTLVDTALSLSSPLPPTPSTAPQRQPPWLSATRCPPHSSPRSPNASCFGTWSLSPLPCSSSSQAHSRTKQTRRPASGSQGARITRVHARSLPPNAVLPGSGTLTTRSSTLTCTSDASTCSRPCRFPTRTPRVSRPASRFSSGRSPYALPRPISHLRRSRLLSYIAVPDR